MRQKTGKKVKKSSAEKRLERFEINIAGCNFPVITSSSMPEGKIAFVSPANVSTEVTLHNFETTEDGKLVYRVIGEMTVHKE